MFLIFAGLGLSFDLTNARNHSPLDLTSNHQVRDEIKRIQATRFCEIHNSRKEFDFFTKRHLCAIGKEVVCRECCSSDFYYMSEEEEAPSLYSTRCRNCLDVINSTEHEMRRAIASGNVDEIIVVKEKILANSIVICKKLEKTIKLEIDRLNRERALMLSIKKLSTVENQKTILKSIHLLQEELQNAQEHGIKLDENIQEKVNATIRRLAAEKELRQLLENNTLADSNYELLAVLGEKLQKALDEKLDAVYTDQGQELHTKMSKRLKFKDILNDFKDYPLREYPEEEVIDPKTKKPIKKKPEPVKKTKKQKKIVFVIPEWAKQLEDLEKTVFF